MVDNVLKARDNNVTFDIGVEKPDGSYAVSSFDEPTYNKVVEVLAALGSPLQEGGTVALSAGTISALQQISVTVDNQTADPETGLAKEVTLQSILTELGQKYEGSAIALNAATLSALGTINVNNLQTDALTNVELRAAPIDVNITGGVSDGLTNTQMRASDVAVNDDAAQALLSAISGALGDTVTADTVRELLLRIYGAVDGLELSVDNIDINTDGVEAELETLNAVDFATQATLDAARVLLVSIDTELATQQTDALTNAELRASDVNVTLDGENVSVTDQHPDPQLDGLTKAQLDVTIVKVDDDNTQAALATLLTEATFLAKDFATEDTLEAARALLSAIDTDTSTLAATDFATESTIATLLTEATFTAEDFATQVTLEATRVLLASIDIELGTQQKDSLTDTELRASDIEVNDDAAQTLLSAISDSLGDTVTANTVRELLLRIYGAVDGLELSVGNIDINTDGVEAELATLNTVDFATQTTLEAARVLLTSIDADISSLSLEDFATQATLVQVLDKLIDAPATEAKQLPDGHAVSATIAATDIILPVDRQAILHTALTDFDGAVTSGTAIFDTVYINIADKDTIDATILSTVAGTLYVEQGVNTSTWPSSYLFSVAADVPLDVTVKARLQECRVWFLPAATGSAELHVRSVA
jgi:hypothetical protein